MVRTRKGTYVKKEYDIINIYLNYGDKEKIQREAKRKKVSVSGYVRNLIKKDFDYENSTDLHE
ncbi:MAG: hypothetical protein LBS21_09505 [Clostridiales bacterium]|nr:hypothetical protein [Clostridiales bacterium]